MEAKDDFQQGERVTVKVLDSVKLSQKEIDEHELTHLLFRNWCRECTGGVWRCRIVPGLAMMETES